MLALYCCYVTLVVRRIHKYYKIEQEVFAIQIT